MPYGGILSGLVEGYGTAVLDKEKQEYEQKQKARQTELSNYNKLMADAMSRQDAATAQWAFDKINEVAHPSGKTQKENPLKSIFGALTGRTPGAQQQPQQGAPGGQQPPAAPQAPAQPVNPQAATPSPAGPVSTTPVFRPQLTPPLQKPGAVDPNISAAGQSGGQGQQRQLPPNLGEVMGQDSATKDARKQLEAKAAQAMQLDTFKQEEAIRTAADLDALKQKGDITLTQDSKRIAQSMTMAASIQADPKLTPQQKLVGLAALGYTPPGVEEVKHISGDKIAQADPNAKDAFGNKIDPKSAYTRTKDSQLIPEAPKAETSTNSAEVKDLRRLEELKRKANLTPEEKDEKTALEYRKKQLDDASQRANTKLTIAIQSVTAPPGSREWANQIAQKIVDHEMAPGQIGEIAKGFGKRTQEVSQMISEGVNRINPHFNYQEADANFKLSSSVGFQQTVRYMDSVQNSIPLVVQRAQELGNSNVRFVNGLANMGKAQLNDPKLAKFQTDALLVADEIAKILQGGGTGSGTSDAKLKQAAQIIRDSDSPKAIAAKLGEVQQLIGYRKDSLTKDTYMGSNSSQNNGGGFSPLPEKPDSQGRPPLSSFEK